jgi:hypothetical protein
MAYPVQSIIAAALLLTLAFTVNDGSRAPAAPAGDGTIQLACGEQADYGTFTTSDMSAAVVSPCTGASAR